MSRERIGLEAVLEDKYFKVAVKNYIGSMDKMSGKTKTTAGKLQSALGGIGSKLLNLGKVAAVAGGALAVGIGVATGKVIADGLKMSMALEEQMSVIESVTGASNEEIEKLGELVKDLGLDPKLKVTAFEAAEAIELLGRNGITTEQMLDGATRATVLLSNATGADFANAAGIASSAMSVFGIEVSKMKEAVDGMVSVTTKSRFSIDDYRLALAQGGGVAASVGVSFDDFNTTIAAIAPLFSSGSDAGTSFKTFLQRLVPQTDKAAGMMQRLGIITEDGQNRFFKANGEMEDMSVIAGVLADTIGGLSDEQKTMALRTLFGTDAMRTAVGLADTGADAFSDLAAEMASVDADKAAATRMDNLSGSLEILDGIIETMKLSIVDELKPAIRAMADSFADFLTDNGPAIVAFFSGLSDTLAVVVPTAFNAATKAMQWVIDNVFPKVAKAVEIVQKAFGGLGSGSAGVPSIMSEILAALAPFWNFWDKHGSEIKKIAGDILTDFIDAATELGSKILPFVLGVLKKFAQWYDDNGPLIVETMQKAADVFGVAMAAIVSFWGVVEPILSQVIDNVLNVGKMVMQVIDGDWKGAWETATDIVTGYITTIITTIENFFDDFLLQTIMGSSWAEFESLWQTNFDNLVTIVGAVWQSIKTTVETWWENVKVAFEGFVTSISNFFTGDGMEDATEGVEAAGEGLMTSLIDSYLAQVENFYLKAAEFVTGIGTWFNGIDWVEVGASIGGFIGHLATDLVNGLADFIEDTTAFITGIVTWWNEIDWAATATGTWNFITSIASAIGEKISDITTAISGMASAAIAWWNQIDWGEVATGIVNFAQSIITSIQTETQGVLTAIGELVTSIGEAFGSIDLASIGGDIVAGLGKGITDAMPGLKEALDTLAGLLPEWVKEVLGIASPSKVFVKIGRNLANSLAKGIRDNTDSVYEAVNAMLGTASQLSSMAGAFFDEFSRGLETSVNFDFVNAVSSFGNAANQALKKELLGPLKKALDTGVDKQLQGIVAEIAKLNKEIEQPSSISAIEKKLKRIYKLQDSITDVAGSGSNEERVVELAKISDEFEQAQKRLKALQEQQAIMQAVGEAGLDMSEIFKGVTLGVDTDVESLTKVLTELSKAQQYNLEEQMFGEEFAKQSNKIRALQNDLILAQEVYDRESTVGGRTSALVWIRNIQKSIELVRGRMADAQVASLKEQQKAQEELLAVEERRAALAEKQADADFLRAQLDLLKMIKKNGLDSEEILGGLKLGLEADALGLADAMTTAMAKMVAAAEKELGIASPSKVMRSIGQYMMEGLGEGIARNANIPARNIMNVSSATTRSFISNTTSNITNNFSLSINGAANPSGVQGDFALMRAAYNV